MSRLGAMNNIGSTEWYLFINVLLISDYVYFETAPSMPYQIRRIEELNKVGSQCNLLSPVR